MASRRKTLRCVIGDATRPTRFIGRQAWALLQLVLAGEHGCTPIDHPAPRWSAYIHDLRKMGLVIDTVHEAHSGAFPGTHGRYILRTAIRIVDEPDE